MEIKRVLWWQQRQFASLTCSGQIIAAIKVLVNLTITILHLRKPLTLTVGSVQNSRRTLTGRNYRLPSGY